MGYDINTLSTDIVKAEAFAKEYGYDYMFNKETGKYEGDAAPYFRANIWGMGHIRSMLIELYNDSIHNGIKDNQFSNILETLSWNDGKIISPSDCQLLIDIYDDSKALALAVANVHQKIAEDSSYLEYKTMVDGEVVTKTATINEAAEGQANLLKEFIVYLGIAKELEGCQVW